MCMSFAYYYPRTPLANCMSLPNYDLADNSECGLDQQDRGRLVLSAAKHRAQMCKVHWRQFEDFNYRFTGNLPPHDYVEPSKCP
ncbi:hypothetical protein DPMN_060026 [Dreissena polymorpha]|uniref:Uncharacterized protein n=1 Tax=Dreissena polymorpha TaxID=45954 RepID=A0A9D4HH44_DREPO|nr:hypothetical protein DPMN_060026 [Dreissena polymorpha]